MQQDWKGQKYKLTERSEDVKKAIFTYDMPRMFNKTIESDCAAQLVMKPGCCWFSTRWWHKNW
jgi:hypothetical protein